MVGGRVGRVVVLVGEPSSRRLGRDPPRQVPDVLGVLAGQPGRREDDLGAESDERVDFSRATVSGRTTTTRYPRTAETCARPAPVLPDVPSTMVPPGSSAPDASAAATMLDAA
ncbi:hypothetical protein GCM10009609_48120 [Pseudonocardia aurantiaca]